jgi:hypothetical protein
MPGAFILQLLLWSEWIRLRYGRLGRRIRPLRIHPRGQPDSCSLPKAGDTSVVLTDIGRHVSVSVIA